MKYMLDASVPIQRYFEEISRIPRKTENEKAVSDYVVKFAKERGLWYRQDELYNVLVRKPAAKGYEKAGVLILQAHMDMVCAKTNESEHDFSKDPLKLVLEGRILRAEGTSLGADDGFGVAYMLAILDDPALKHPELECVFTTQEEHKTMVGAEYFDTSDLKGKRMIGLDGDGETSTFVASACSHLITLTRHVDFIPASGAVCAIEISKLTGSVLKGVVHQECGNAIKIVFRLLAGVMDENIRIQLCEVEGGEGENRNPTRCKAVFTCEPGAVDQIKRLMENAYTAMSNEYKDGGYTAEYQFQTDLNTVSMLSEEATRDMIRMIYLLPNNLFQNNVRTNELQAVNNLGLIKMEAETLVITMSSRSLKKAPEEELTRHIRLLSATLGFDCEIQSRYHSWEYVAESAIRKCANDVYLERYSHELGEIICPGGLELGWFFEKIKNLDAIMLGPVHDNVHTVDEFMDLDSFERVYQNLINIMERLTD